MAKKDNKQIKGTILYQSKKGINLTDGGFYFARNSKNGNICILSITKNIVYVHDITRYISLENLIDYDRVGHLEIFDKLISEKDTIKS